ncbi:MAG: 50S ribosomal protein L22 [Candidatus Nanoarchaeia archaeon]
MTSLRYSFQGFDSKTMVRVAGRNLPISHKASYEIAKFIKGRKVTWALKALENVIEKKVAIPYTRYCMDVAPKPGIGSAARYPVKASRYIIKLLRNLQGAARNKNFDVNNLTIIHAAAQKGPIRHRYGRKVGLERKNTHFELIAKEIKQEKKEKNKKEAQVK